METRASTTNSSVTPTDRSLLEETRASTSSSSVTPTDRSLLEEERASTTASSETLAPPTIFKQTAEAIVEDLDILLNGTPGTFKSVVEYNGNYYDQNLNKLPMTEVTVANLEQYGFELTSLYNFKNPVTVYTLVDQETMNSNETVTMELSYDLNITREITYQISFDKETWYGYDGTKLVERYEMTKAEFESMNIGISNDEIYYKTIIRSDDDTYPVLEQISTTFEPQSHMEAEIEVPHHSDLAGKLDIPATFTEVVEANKDTYINEYAKTSRYGDMTELRVGTNYKTLIGFDFNLTDASIIKSAKLVLGEINSIGQEIDIRRLLSDWRESDTTWANAPDAGFESYGRLTGEEVDITELVKKWHSGELENNGILLEGLNEVVQRYYSREYNNFVDRPRLEIKYYDPNILAYNGTGNLISNIDVPYSNDLQGSIEIDPLTDPDLESQIEVKYRGNDDLIGSITIREDKIEELPGEMTISKPVMPGTAFVAERNDLPSTIEIKESDESDITIEGAISRPDMPGYVELTIHDSINGLVTIRQDTNDDLTIEGAISKPDLPAKAEVPYRDDLISEIIVRQDAESDLTIEGAISKPDLPASIWPRLHNDLISTMTIRQDDKSDIIIEGAVSRPDMPGDVIVPFRNNLPSTMTIRQDDKSDIIIEGAVSRPDIPAEIELVIASSIPGTITVKRYHDEDLSCQMDIVAYGTNDLRARIIKRPRAISEIECTLSVDFDSFYADNDLTSKIHIRLKLPRHWNHDKDPELPRLWYKNANRWVNDNV